MHTATCVTQVVSTSQTVWARFWPPDATHSTRVMKGRDLLRTHALHDSQHRATSSRAFPLSETGEKNLGMATNCAVLGPNPTLLHCAAMSAHSIPPQVVEGLASHDVTARVEATTAVRRLLSAGVSVRAASAHVCVCVSVRFVSSVRAVRRHRGGPSHFCCHRSRVGPHVGPGVGVRVGTACSALHRGTRRGEGALAADDSRSAEVQG